MPEPLLRQFQAFALLLDVSAKDFPRIHIRDARWTQPKALRPKPHILVLFASDEANVKERSVGRGKSISLSVARFESPADSLVGIVGSVRISSS